MTLLLRSVAQEFNHFKTIWFFSFYANPNSFKEIQIFQTHIIISSTIFLPLPVLALLLRRRPGYLRPPPPRQLLHSADVHDAVVEVRHHAGHVPKERKGRGTLSFQKKIIYKFA